MANDYIKFGRPEFEVVGGKFHARFLLLRSLFVFLEGYLSPVSDAYKKVCLVRGKDLLGTSWSHLLKDSFRPDLRVQNID